MVIQSRRRFILISLTVLLCAVLYFTVMQPAAAAANLGVTINSVDCSSGHFSITFDVFSDQHNGTATVNTGVENLENGSISIKSSDVTFPGGASITHDHNINVDKGDELKFGIVVQVGGSTVLSKFKTRTCGKAEGPPFIPGVVPMDPAAAAPFLAIPTPGGVLPCGVFDVGGWGLKIIWVEDFPDCVEHAPRLGVGCLTADGQWTDENVHRLRIRADFHEMKFGSTQHGTCAVFPAQSRPPIYGN